MYKKPEVKSYSREKILDLIGPVQSASVNLNFQQVAMSNTVSNQSLVRFEEAKNPVIYNNNQTKIG